MGKSLAQVSSAPIAAWRRPPEGRSRGELPRPVQIVRVPLTDAAGRHVRQIELCPQHCEIVIERERTRGLEIWYRRGE